MIPRGAKTPDPISMKLGIVDYVRDSIPHYNLVRVAQRGWSGQICDLSHLRVSSLSFFCFLHHTPRSHFLTSRDHHCAKMRVLGQGCAFWGSRQYLTMLREINPRKKKQKWVGIGISQPNRQSCKIAIYWSPSKIFTSNFTDRLNTGGSINTAKLHQMGS